jgi:hypothetical protein
MARRKYWLTYAVTLVSALIVSRSGQAESVGAKEREARTACLAGDYAKGVTLLSEMFVATKNPTWIFNSGRCFEQNSRYQDAISRFKEYLRVSKHLTDEEKTDVQKHIDDCQESLAAVPSPSPLAAQPVTPVTPQPPPSAGSQPPSFTQPVQEPLSTSTASPAPAESGSTLRTTGIVVGAIGLATVATAVILNLKTNQLADAGDESGQKSYRNGALTCYGVGGAAVAAGLVMYLLGHKADAAASTGMALLPVWTSDGAALAIRGDF